MQPILSELPEYVTQQQADPALSPAEALIGARDLRILAITILGWLKEQALDDKRRKLRGLERYTWCQNLTKLISELAEWGQLFEGDGQTFDFHHNLTTEEIAEIIGHTSDRYNPVVRFTRRRQPGQT